MSKTLKSNFWIIITFLLSSCSQFETPERRLVIEGWIESGDYPVVILTFPYRPNEVYSAENAVVRPAKVILEEDNNKWQLTGVYDSRYFPPYIYTNYQIKGEIGKKYRLSVYYDDLKAHAETEILPPPMILGATLSVDSSDNQYRKLSINTSTATGCSDYLMTFIRTDTSGKRPLPSYLGVAHIPKDENTVILDVLRPKSKLDTIPYNSGFKVGETIEVHLCRLSLASYEFWVDFQSAVTLGHSPLISSSYSLRTNVTGDGIGYFFGYGTDRKVLQIQ